MSRGYAAIALDNPKNPLNVGAACRAVSCYDASLIVLGGQRFRKWPTDTRKTWRHTPLLEVGDVFDAIPYDCVPVAVDLVAGAIALPQYVHPDRAFYVFGAEDATLGDRILSRCRDRIFVPTRGCMNLAAAVNVVLYDRAAKRNEWVGEQEVA